MNEINCQTWTQVFKKALLELNSNMLIERIEMAEAAIDERLHDLRHDATITQSANHWRARSPGVTKHHP